MSVKKKEDLIIGKNYYLAIIDDSRYADKVTLEKIEQPSHPNPFSLMRQTRIHVRNTKKQLMVFDIRQIGIGATKKEATKNFLML